MIISEIDWLLGIGLMFGLSLIMTYLTYRDMETFFIWLPVFTGFVVWANLLDTWVLVMSLIALCLIIAFNIKKGREI